MMPPALLAQCVGATIEAVVDLTDAKTERERMEVLRCIMAMAAADLYKIVGKAQTQAQLADLSGAFDRAEAKLKGKLDA